MKVSKIQEKGWKLLLNLFKAANDDQIITFDEGRIIRTADLNVTKLYEYAQEAWEDKVLTEEEKLKITFLIKKILDDAVTIAEFDEIITDQEKTLLDIIREIVEEFYEDR